MKMYKNSQKAQSNQRTSKMCTIIRHTLCKSLVKIQYFRHEWTLIMYKSSLKTQQSQGTFYNWQLHLAHQYKMCVLIRHTFCESFVLYQIQMSVIFVILFTVKIL